MRLGVSVPELERPGLRGELPLDPLSLCPMGVGEEELLEDELEKKELTTRCGEQFKPTPFSFRALHGLIGLLCLVFLLG